MSVAVVDSVSEKVNWLQVPQEEQQANLARAQADTDFILNHWQQGKQAFMAHIQKIDPSCTRGEDDYFTRDCLDRFQSMMLDINKPSQDLDQPHVVTGLRGFGASYNQYMQPINDFVRANKHVHAYDVRALVKGQITPKDFTKRLAAAYEIQSIDSRISEPSQTHEQLTVLEGKRRKLVLEGWSQDLAAHGVAFDAHSMFAERSLSGNLLFTGKGVFIPGDEDIRSNHIENVNSFHSPKERYRFTFGFVSKQLIDNPPIQAATAYVLDPRIMAALRAVDGDKLGQNILRSYHMMADTANHDYIHSTVFPLHRATTGSPLEQALGDTKAVWDEHMPIGNVEIYSHIAHRQTMQHLFAERPGMKAGLINKAVQFVGLMEKFRERAQAQGALTPRQAQEMSEFLLRMYVQRMNTMINPADAELAPLREAVEHFGMRPQIVSAAYIADSLRSRGEFEAFASKLPPEGRPHFPDSDAESIQHALSGAFDNHPSYRTRANIRMWRDILHETPPNPDGSYTLTGYNVLRKNVGAFMQMVCDTNDMMVGDELLTMPQITQRYVEEFAAISRNLPEGTKPSTVIDDSMVARGRIQKRAAEHTQNMDALHIGALRSLLPEFKASADTPEAHEHIEAFSKALDGAQRTLRLPVKNAAQWSADSKLAAADNVVEWAKGKDSALAHKLEPHVAAFKSGIEEKLAEPAGRKR